jgi:Beta-lactamase enzyme family
MLRALVCAVALLAAAPAAAYPLDGYPDTGIRRLLGISLAIQGVIRDVAQPPGALLALKEVDLRLAGQTFDLPTPDPAFTAQVAGLLGGSLGSYGLAVLDLTDPAAPRYAELRGDQKQNVGSVGKIVVALALFQALADAYPDDIEARRRVLRTTVVTADAFSHYDHHTVRMFDPATKTLTRRPIQIGDRASLWEYVDWMMSPSSNAAAGMVMREAMLLRQYGRAYPPAEAEIRRFFADTPPAERTALFVRTFYEPVTKNGLDLERLRQGSVFTAGGKRAVPGPGDSYGTARDLLRYLVRMEQGRLVDAWSSREIKRLMYITERRIRYASAPALADAAVYFKSGSLYQCAPEPGFRCGQYMGNVKNYMNSIAIVEWPARDRKLYYMVALISNVLRKNSAADHQALAASLHRLIGGAPVATADGAASPRPPHGSGPPSGSR